ncbi:PAS domain S-box protein [Pseudodesulfovibrio piezophilus]|uniref:histidine kinase n=1 Tax=Pseudodesulfovibrio piezophilus (strain DSM 21447 / JCM 15486 / C1TLV30) TaxID=1322246 RepID=M1WVB7_PSEP2|nr:PAS domain S-box protein [Pseudodesulfovibrio piezophilus]CCH48308.1 Multi-sensor signal transduction histidine kinase (modular protein) [Pseudodesulfovibrio piezophilus C1TLV30]
MSDHDRSKEELAIELASLRACLELPQSMPAQLHPSDETYKQVLDALPQMVYEMDENGQFIYANTEALRSFNYSHKDFLNGVNLAQIVDPKDLERAKDNMEKALSGNGYQGEEYTGIRKDGSRFPLKVYSQTVYNKAGAPVGIRGTVLDLSEVRQAEKALKKSETYYRTLFENTGTAMAIFGEDSVILSCNSQFARLSGFAVADVEKKMMWTQFVRADEIDHVHRKHESTRGQISEKPHTYRCTFIPRTGEEKLIQVFMQLIPETRNRVCSLIDVTEVVRAEEALKKSEAYYRTLFGNTGTAMIIFGENGIIQSCNAHFEKLAGCPSTEIIGKMLLWDFVSPEDLDRMMMYHERRPSENRYTPQDYEFNFLTPDNKEKIVHVFIQYIPESSDRACSLIDITDRKQIEQALRKSEERYQLVVQGANDGIWDWNLESNYVYYSPRYKAILGYEDHEFSNTAESWTDHVHPDDLAHTIAANKECIEGKKDKFEVEYRMRHKDGTYRWIHGRGTSTRNEQGDIYRLAGTHTDITARKLQERTTNARYAIAKAIETSEAMHHLYAEIHGVLDRLIHAGNFFIALLDEKNDRITFPYFKDEKDEYRDIENVSNPKTKSLIGHVLRSGEPIFFSNASPETARPELQADTIGTPAAVWLGVPLRLKDKVVGAMAVQHYSDPYHYSDADVSLMKAAAEQVAIVIERKANEEALTRLNEELESKVEMRTAELLENTAQLEAANRRLTELDEIKSALVSSVSHELRTPLTSIRGFAKLTGKDFVKFFTPLSHSQLLKEKGERIVKNLEIIESEGVRLTRLINDFLDINRIESGKVIWNDTLLNPCEVIRNASSALVGAFAAKPEVALFTNMPTKVSPINADPDKIQQVIINLLNNACKFTLEGTVTVSLLEKTDHLLISVSDTGIGIPEDEQKHIFEKFHKSRAGDTISIKDKGTGLGLAICREIVTHYKGKIWVESIPGKGSHFHFTIPTISGTETSCL